MQAQKSSPPAEEEFPPVGLLCSGEGEDPALSVSEWPGKIKKRKNKRQSVEYPALCLLPWSLEGVSHVVGQLCRAVLYLFYHMF